MDEIAWLWWVSLARVMKTAGLACSGTLWTGKLWTGALWTGTCSLGVLKRSVCIRPQMCLFNLMGPFPVSCFLSRRFLSHGYGTVLLGLLESNQ